MVLTHDTSYLLCQGSDLTTISLFLDRIYRITFGFLYVFCALVVRYPQSSFDSCRHRPAPGSFPWRHPGRTGRLPSQSPHRPVRARLTHTVPQDMVSLRVLTRTHFLRYLLLLRIRVQDFNASAAFPNNSSIYPTRPFPTPALLGLNSPASSVLCPC